MISSVLTNYPDGPPLPGTGPGKLYVFIHGLICLVEAADRFLALVVDLGDEHSYRVGDWLVEVPIKRGAQMKLKGVDETGRGELVDKEITIVHKPIDASATHFAAIELPRPKTNVLSLRRTKIPANLVSGAG